MEDYKYEFLKKLSENNFANNDFIKLYLKLLPVLKEKQGPASCKFIKRLISCRLFVKETGTIPNASDTYGDEKIGQWFQSQRQAYLKGKMSSERKIFFDAMKLPLEKQKNRQINEDEGLEKNQRIWLYKLSVFKEFRKTFGRNPFKREIYRDIAIGSWVYTQQSKYKNRCLAKDRENMLREAGVFLDDTERTPEFKEMLLMYKIYKQIAGTDPHPRVMIENVALGEWLAMQDFLYSKNELPKEYHDKLSEAGFQFSRDKNPKLNWEQMFFLYQKFKKDTGCEPKTTEIYGCVNLGEWVSDQRKSVKELSKVQKNKLISAGFSFDPHNDQWNEKFAVLCDFVNDFEMLPLPKAVYKGVEIGNWLWITQKTAFYDKSLSEQRQKMLESVGFSFDYSEATRSFSHYSKMWAEKYKDLKVFIETHQRLPKARHEFGEYKKESNIGRWYQKQKVAQTHGYLTKAQIKKLKEIETKVEEYQLEQQKEEKNYDTEGER